MSVDLHVDVEFPRGFDPRDEIGKHRLRQWRPVRGAAVALARAMKRRVRETGKAPDVFAGYKGQTTRADGRKGGDRLIATGYPLVAQPEAVRTDGLLMFKSSRSFHNAAGVRRGSFDVSGGMWGGLAVVLSGANKARIAFRGRSPGYSPQRGKGGFSTRGTKVSNAIKASTVFGSHSVNVVKNTTAERDAMASSITASSAAVVGQSFGIQPTDIRVRGKKGSSRLIRDMVRAIKNGERNV